MECLCGAEIHLLEGERAEDALAIWVDDRGNDRCYPNEPGRDGQARHEPDGLADTEGDGA